MPDVQKINLRTFERTLLSAVPPNQESLFTLNTDEPIMYVMQAGRPTGQAVLMIPGGGYNKVALAQCFETASWLNSLGITCLVLEYRLPNGDCAKTLDDIYAAWRFLSDNAKEWGISADKTGIMGYSAGGQLAANWSTINADSPALRPAFTVLLYPVINLLDPAQDDLAKRFLGKAPAPGELDKYSAHLQTGAKTPPALILLCDDDAAVQPMHGVLYYSALKESGVPASLYVFPDGGHAWSLGSGDLSGRLFKHAETSMRLMADWLSCF